MMNENLYDYEQDINDFSIQSKDILQNNHLLMTNSASNSYCSTTNNDSFTIQLDSNCWSSQDSVINTQNSVSYSNYKASNPDLKRNVSGSNNDYQQSSSLQNATATDTLASRQTYITRRWLEENFQERDSVSISRSTIYDLYVRFCELNFFISVCKATFGKLIRSTFSNVKSKRLGARGQSKYHYYNISFRDPQKRCLMRLDSGGHFTQDSFSEEYSSSKTSTYMNDVQDNTVYNSSYSKDRSNNEQNFVLSHNSNEKKHRMLTIFSAKPNEKNFTTFNLNCTDYHGVIQAMLSFLKVPMVEPLTNKKSVFMNLYRIHCQCLIDAALSSNYAQIRHYFIHFWKQLPIDLIDTESMKLLDYKMLELLEIFFLSNVANIHKIDWSQVISINTMLQLIPNWLQILIDDCSFDNPDNSTNIQTIFEQKLSISYSIASKFRSKVEFLFMLDKLTTLPVLPICDYLQELVIKYCLQESSFYNNSFDYLPDLFVKLLTSTSEYLQKRSNNPEKECFLRFFIDSLDEFYENILDKTLASERVVCFEVIKFCKTLNLYILDDSLMNDCDEFEDISSEEEFKIFEYFEKNKNNNDNLDQTNDDSDDNVLKNNVRLLLFVIENYCIEICQNFHQKMILPK